jgi:hypothetical protein
MERSPRQPRRWRSKRPNLVVAHALHNIPELVRRQTQPREIKVALLASHQPKDYRGDVWLLTERDAGTSIANPFPCDLALELGKGEQDIEGQPPHAGRGVEGLGDGDERDLPPASRPWSRTACASRSWMPRRPISPGAPISCE